VNDFHHHEDYASLRFLGPDARTSVKPYGIERRLPLITSTVVGSPEPPPPYRIRRVFPQLKTTYPVFITRQPGSNRLLYLALDWSYGPTKLFRIPDEPNVSQPEMLLAINEVAYDIAFHPDFLHNGYLYIGGNGPNQGKVPKQSRVTRYTMDPKPPYRLDPKSAKVIIEWPSNGHNGHALRFGQDGMLYVTSGDGTSDSDTNVVGQDMTKLTSKLLRIDVNHPAPGKMYSVPSDNPFVGKKDTRPETWAYGFRNPWRMAVDEKTGHIWVGQNGQDLFEQAFLIQKGANYGWSVYEGSHPFYLQRKLGPTPHVLPTIEHPHSEFRSLTGGLVYYGNKFPELRGAYIYGDHDTGKVWGMKHDGKKALWHRELADTRIKITSFGADTHGEILISDYRGRDQGAFFTLEATPKDEPTTKFPRTLSASGLFRSVKGHEMEPALIPYSVNAPLWSDGAYKERWLALPGGDSRIHFTRAHGWEFPDQTVLVKSFALELEEGNPASRRWIETRFLTNQRGEWFGYSYRWNDDQTDGTLVEAKGLDHTFTIRVPRSAEHPDGERKQTWHYPSRTECMVCHSRAANYVLGLTELQMNKEHDYGGIRDNQLRTLEHLGVFRVDWADEIRAKYHDRPATRMQREPVESSLLTFPPEQYDRLVDPYDAKQDLGARARSYLHANCAQCHVEAGGGNAQMHLEFTTALGKTRLLDVKPVHDTYGLPDARLVAPGHPERSVLLHRISHRAAGHMPPLATALVDQEAVRLMREWIAGLKAPTGKGK
jgi:uncharacterized repeat protein (TIGR03806 family)